MCICLCYFVGLARFPFQNRVLKQSTWAVHLHTTNGGRIWTQSTGMQVCPWLGCQARFESMPARNKHVQKLNEVPCRVAEGFISVWLFFFNNECSLSNLAVTTINLVGIMSPSGAFEQFGSPFLDKGTTVFIFWKVFPPFDPQVACS